MDGKQWWFSKGKPVWRVGVIKDRKTPLATVVPGKLLEGGAAKLDKELCQRGIKEPALAVLLGPLSGDVP